ncbi:unnamed protein product [Protopolystoma xenopodis]|uniref:Uncharacterized protein n=1 Tax=Protopolystoma xenopodis TaxID=117903 RepID=A0A448WKS5_9PLAT|nr:unnamed protein product [Protopolystoma xenopodis]
MTYQAGGSRFSPISASAACTQPPDHENWLSSALTQNPRYFTRLEDRQTILPEVNKSVYDLELMLALLMHQSLPAQAEAAEWLASQATEQKPSPMVMTAPKETTLLETNSPSIVNGLAEDSGYASTRACIWTPQLCAQAKYFTGMHASYDRGSARSSISENVAPPIDELSREEGNEAWRRSSMKSPILALRQNFRQREGSNLLDPTVICKSDTISAVSSLPPQTASQLPALSCPAAFSPSVMCPSHSLPSTITGECEKEILRLLSQLPISQQLAWMQTLKLL